jgi:putative DNA primase/helicase
VSALEEFGVVPNSGEQRIQCPRCSSRKKTLGVDSDTGVFHCFRCGYKGRDGAPRNWLEGELGRLQKRSQNRAERHQQAADNAQSMWDRSRRCYWHPYLRRKAVLPLGIRQNGRLLMVPMYDTDGKLWNVQTIDEDGTKLFLRGGKTKGLYYPIKGKSEEIIVCEGFATGAAIHMHIRPHSRVAIAFNAGNLKPVAQALHLTHFDTKLIIAADDDQWTEGNPGVTKAREAAKAVRGKLMQPNWEGLDLGEKPTDFNDLWRLRRKQ